MDENDANSMVMASSTNTSTNTMGRIVMPEPNTTCPTICAIPDPSSAPTTAPTSEITAVSASIRRDTAPSVAPMALSSASSAPRSPIAEAIRFATAIAAAISDSTVMSTITACVFCSTSPCKAATWRTCLATAPGITSSIW